MPVAEVIQSLKKLSDPARIDGMKRYGIDTSKAIGVAIPDVRRLARSYKKDQELSLKLWATGIHEARILASIIGDPAQVTEKQMDAWTKEFNSWDVCDQVCGNLFDRTPFAVDKAFEYSKHEEEYIKRAGFVLMAELAVHAKNMDNEVFLSFFPVMEREANDNRNFVKKAVNWALRQIGKRNSILQKAAVETAKRMLKQDSKAAKWIATDALKELENRVLKK
ncbi:MAG: DNA alkylation repair protein [Mucilaginibacter sp.]